MIIAFSGRIGSGKSELAKICQNKGFEKLYFALPLKQLVANLIHVGIEDINPLKNVEKKYKFTKKDYIYLANETNIPFETIRDEMKNVKLNTVRQLLQFIGTDIIRKYNPNWHVNKIKTMIDKDKNYVFDDVRFPNELKLIKELGGDCWFIIRPIINNVSNHISEISLTWKDFDDKVIINDGNLEKFIYKWTVFFENYDKALKIRDKYTTSNTFKKILYNIFEPLSAADMLEIFTEFYSYKPRTFNKENIQNITQDNNNVVTITYKDNTKELVKNAINIEDMKLIL